MILSPEIREDICLKSITFCKYKLIIGPKKINLSFPQLLELRKNINNLVHPRSLKELVSSDNFTLLFIADKTHLVYLDISQLLYLKQEFEILFKHHYPVLV